MILDAIFYRNLNSDINEANLKKADCNKIKNQSYYKIYKNNKFFKGTFKEYMDFISRSKGACCICDSQYSPTMTAGEIYQIGIDEEIERFGCSRRQLDGEIKKVN